MHPDTHVLVRTFNHVQLDSSTIGQAGDAPMLDMVWEHLKAQHLPIIQVGYIESCEPDNYSVYDVTKDAYTPLLRIARVEPKAPVDWRVIHFNDGRHLFVTADVLFELIHRGRLAQPNPVMASSLCFDEAVRRDAHLWWTQEMWPACWVRRDLAYGENYTTVLGFSIPKIKPKYFFELLTESGHFTANGIDVCCNIAKEAK